ncbi:S9 family peptidase [Maricaulis sp.]|uniref:alpha/beta hydrolase family protein n=1 Tax=Maricaulis sp. TaxID=1486257 RepID=UPI0026086B4D|nr:S9 family peptidase [Maricaulis sp.]
MLRHLSLLLLLAPLPAWAQDSALEPLDVFSLEAVSQPQFAPDGSQIAYLRASNDITTDSTRSSIWLIDADGERHRAMDGSAATMSSPRWSPQSDRLAYVRSEGDVTSINIYLPADGRDEQVLELAGGAAGLSWSPDGKFLAFAGFVPEPPLPPAALPERGDHNWAAAAQVEDRLVFRIDGIGPLPRGGQQLYVLDVAKGAVRQITREANSSGADFAWSADGSALIFSADRRENAGTQAPDTDIYRLDVQSGAITAITDRRGPDNAPRPSPDGQMIAYLGYDDRLMGYHNTELYIAAADGSGARSLTASLDRSVAAPVWAADGSGLYVQMIDQGDTHIAFVDLEGGVERLASGIGGAAFGRPYTGGSYSVAANGQIAYTTASGTRPAELAVGNTADGFEVLTALNEDVLAGRYISEVEDIRFASPHDGLEIQGWVLYPPGFDPDQTYPMILEIHGGPFSAYGPVFSAEFQLMAAQGYVVLYTNPRGSTSYGYDFANEIHHAYPGNDYHDLMGAVDHMVERGFIDEDRLFITGGSGGGTLTAWAIGQTDRFAAAAVVKPVINWSSFVLYSDLPQFFSRYWFGVEPWEDPDAYWQRSPLSLVGEVDTPTLMMVGGADVRTPPAETEQYYSALKLRGVPTDLVVIPDSFHSISNSTPSRLLAKVAEILRWFERYDPALEAEAE